MKRIKKLLELFGLIILAILPSKLKILVYNEFLNCDIHPTARLGFSYIKVKSIKMGPNTTIKSLCLIKNLELLEMGAKASIGRFNKISAMPLSEKRNFQSETNRFPALIMGRNAAIVSHHYFDCNNQITIGDFTIVAGSGTAFFTHSINIEKNLQETLPIEIGKYCLISSRCVIVKGAKLPDYSVLGANSMLHKTYTEPYCLYSGVPAVPIKQYDPNSAYFTRTVGFVP